MDKEVQELVTELINYDNKEDLSWLQVLKTLLKERNLEIESIKPGESVTKEYDMTVKEIEGAGTTTGNIKKSN